MIFLPLLNSNPALTLKVVSSIKTLHFILLTGTGYLLRDRNLFTKSSVELTGQGEDCNKCVWHAGFLQIMIYLNAGILGAKFGWGDGVVAYLSLYKLAVILSFLLLCTNQNLQPKYYFQKCNIFKHIKFRQQPSL